MLTLFVIAVIMMESDMSFTNDWEGIPVALAIDASNICATLLVCQYFGMI